MSDPRPRSAEPAVGKQTLVSQAPGDAAPPGVEPWVGAWVASLVTAPALRQARLDLTAAQAGSSLTLGGRSITISDPQRVTLLDAVRRQLMARVVAVRAPLRPRLAAASDAVARRAVQDEMRSAARPFLDELRDPAQPGARFAGDPAVQDEVLAALTLDGEGHAEAELADQIAHGADGARARTRATAHLPHGAWCGAFAYAQQNGAGLSEHVRSSMHATGPHSGIDAMLDYENHSEVIWSGTEWMPLRAYHASRSSPRRLTRTPRTPTQITPGSVAAPHGLDIRPGDLILIDNARGTFADHIAQCRSYDAATGQLETIGGNEGGGEGRIAASAHPRDLNSNPEARTVEGHESKRSRVYAYGRFSIVDYETHTYLPHMPADPTQSPEAMSAQHSGRHH